MSIIKSRKDTVEVATRVEKKKRSTDIDEEDIVGVKPVQKKQRSETVGKKDIAELPISDQEIIGKKPATHIIQIYRSMDLILHYITYKETDLCRKHNPSLCNIVGFIQKVQTTTHFMDKSSGRYATRDQVGYVSHCLISDLGAKYCAELLVTLLKELRDAMKKSGCDKLDECKYQLEQLRKFIKDLSKQIPS